MSYADSEQLHEIASPTDTYQVPDDCTSYTLRGDVTTALVVSCNKCRRCKGDPHTYCISHLLEAGMPVCTRKSRCGKCADCDQAFWVRYMKSYYNGCRRLTSDEFNTHLEVQSYYGIQTDHRRRADGTPVYTLRGNSSSEPTPEKTIPSRITATATEAAATAQSSHSTIMSSSSTSLPPLVRPLDVTGRVGEAIAPESLLSEEEQEVIRQFRARQQSAAPSLAPAVLMEVPSQHVTVGRVCGPTLPSVETFRKTPVRPLAAPAKLPVMPKNRQVAYSPQHTAESIEQLELDSQWSSQIDDDATDYPVDEVTEFWQQHDAVLRLDHEIRLVHELGDSNTNVVGFSDAEDTSDEETGSVDDRGLAAPLSRHVVKRPCELRNDLIVRRDAGIFVLNPEQIMQQCTVAFGTELSRGLRAKTFRKRLCRTLRAAVDDYGTVQTEGLEEKLMDVVRLDHPDGDYDDDEPADTGKEGKRAPAQSGSHASQRDRSPSKTPATSGAATSSGKQRARRRTDDGDDEDEDDDDQRKRKRRRHPGEKEMPDDAISDDEEDETPPVKFPAATMKPTLQTLRNVTRQPFEDAPSTSEPDAARYNIQKGLYADNDERRRYRAYVDQHNILPAADAESDRVKLAVSRVRPLPVDMQEPITPGSGARVRGQPFHAVSRSGADAVSVTSRESTSSVKSSPDDTKLSNTTNEKLRERNKYHLYARPEPKDLPPGWGDTCGVTCCEQTIVANPVAYELRVAQNVVRHHLRDVVQEVTTVYKAGQRGVQKDSAMRIESMAFDPTLREMITDAWNSVGQRASQFAGFGNLPTAAELYVPWAPYLRPDGEPSFQVEGLQVPLDSEICKKARRWHQDGRHITGTIISRPSMFDLHRIQNKRMRVTSHQGQLLKASREVIWKLIGHLFPGGLKRKEGEVDNDSQAFLRKHLRHLLTLAMGMGRAHEAGQKLDTSLHLMVTVAYRDGVLLNTDCEDELVPLLRFSDPFGTRLVIDPEVMAEFYEEDTPVTKMVTIRHLKKYREIRQEIEREMHGVSTGVTTPAKLGAAIIPDARLNVMGDLQIPGSRMTIPMAKPYVTNYLSPSERVNQTIIRAISAAVYAWLRKERQRKQRDVQQQAAVQQAQTAPANIRRALARHPDAVSQEEVDRRYTQMRTEGGQPLPADVIPVLDSPAPVGSRLAAMQSSHAPRPVATDATREKVAEVQRLLAGDPDAAAVFMQELQQAQGGVFVTTPQGQPMQLGTTTTPRGSAPRASMSGAASVGSGRSARSGHSTRQRSRAAPTSTVTRAADDDEPSAAAATQPPTTPDIIGPSDDDTPAP